MPNDGIWSDDHVLSTQFSIADDAKKTKSRQLSELSTGRRLMIVIAIISTLIRNRPLFDSRY